MTQGEEMDSEETEEKHEKVFTDTNRNLNSSNPFITQDTDVQLI